MPLEPLGALPKGFRSVAEPPDFAYRWKKSQFYFYIAPLNKKIKVCLRFFQAFFYLGQLLFDRCRVLNGFRVLAELLQLRPSLLIDKTISKSISKKLKKSNFLKPEESGEARLHVCYVARSALERACPPRHGPDQAVRA